MGRNSKKPCQQLLCWLLLSQRKSDKGGVEILVHFALAELLAVWKWTKSTGWEQLAVVTYGELTVGYRYHRDDSEPGRVSAPISFLV